MKSRLRDKSQQDGSAKMDQQNCISRLQMQIPSPHQSILTNEYKKGDFFFAVAEGVFWGLVVVFSAFLPHGSLKLSGNVGKFSHWTGVSVFGECNFSNEEA
jgi:hypothetical protein